MNKLAPLGTPERQEQVRRLLTDTGYFCRFVLGMDTDRGEHGAISGAIGKGGVRDHGPHQQVVEFLDNEDPTNRHRCLMAPRRSYKSSIVRGFILRKILAHPDICIVLLMHEQDMAIEQCDAIKNILETNPIIQELAGDMRGILWRKDKFITSHRLDKTITSPTLRVGSPQKIPTGGRADLVLFDDIVSDQNSRTDNGLELGRRCVERTLFLGSPGCLYVDVGTPYHYGDAHHWIMANPGWKKLVHLDVGFDVVVRDDKSLGLAGEGVWPNLTKEFLETQLRGGMSFPSFMSQYKLQVVAGTHQAFHRHQFQPIGWKEEFQDLTGYLLTDVAQGTPEGAIVNSTNKNCLNVLMYVGVDHRNRVYILDLEVGRWPMLEFSNRYFGMLERWWGKVNHRGELWEQVHSNTAYASFLGIQAKQRNQQLRIFWQKRVTSKDGKFARINATQGRFQALEVYVCSTVPRTWVDDAEVRELWNPEGFLDPVTRARLPGGDMVEQFIRFPHHPYLDIPDAFSLVDSLDTQTGQRVCFWMRPSRMRVSEDSRRQQVSSGHGVGAKDRFYRRLKTKRRFHA